MRQIRANLDQRHYLPVVRQRGIEAAESVGNASPFLHGRRARIPAVNRVPDKGAYHAKSSDTSGWERVGILLPRSVLLVFHQRWRPAKLMEEEYQRRFAGGDDLILKAMI
jgi:hypothetical protein